MKLAYVRGTVVSTILHPALKGYRLLVCDLLQPDGHPTGRYTIAIAAIDAGIGQRVLVLDEGNSARQILGLPDAPVRAVVVGIVDTVQMDEAGV